MSTLFQRHEHAEKLGMGDMSSNILRVKEYAVTKV